MIDFTVLIPVFNTKKVALTEALNSILNQTLKCPNKIVIVNDGSTDLDTLEVIAKYVEGGHVICYDLEKNYGTPTALNHGHDKITTEYIALMGSDDISHRERFEKQIRFLKQNPSCDVLGTQLSMFYDNKDKKPSGWNTSHPVKPISGKGWQTNHGTVIYKNQAVKDVGGYNPEMLRAQDIDLFNRMMSAGKSFHNLKNVLYKWRRYV
jgi:glycosyltransferase EpsE